MVELLATHRFEPVTSCRESTLLLKPEMLGIRGLLHQIPEAVIWNMTDAIAFSYIAFSIWPMHEHAKGMRDIQIFKL